MNKLPATEVIENEVSETQIAAKNESAGDAVTPIDLENVQGGAFFGYGPAYGYYAPWGGYAPRYNPRFAAPRGGFGPGYWGRGWAPYRWF